MQGAYVALLGRPPEADGLAFYVRRLRAGIRKEDLLAELAGSSEAKQHASGLSGLDQLLATRTAREPSLLERVIKRLFAPAVEPLARQLRVVDNAVARLVDDRAVEQQTARIAAKLDMLALRVRGSRDAPDERQPVATPLTESDASTSRDILEMKRFLESPPP